MSSSRTILLNSYTAKHDCIRWYKCNQDNLFVVPFSVYVKRKINWETACATRKEYGLPEHFYYVPNQFWIHKNHSLLVDAVRDMGECGNLVIVASGQTTDVRHPSYFEGLSAAIDRHDLGLRFRILGRIPYDHVLCLMVASRAVINPSFFEGRSSTVEEAKSLGVKTLLSDIPSHREQAGEDAIFFHPRSVKSFIGAVEECEVAALAQSGARHAPSPIGDQNASLREYAERFESVVLAAVTGDRRADRTVRSANTGDAERE